MNIQCGNCSRQTYPQYFQVKYLLNFFLEKPDIGHLVNRGLNCVDPIIFPLCTLTCYHYVVDWAPKAIKGPSIALLLMGKHCKSLAVF